MARFTHIFTLAIAVLACLITAPVVTSSIIDPDTICENAAYEISLVIDVSGSIYSQCQPSNSLHCWNIVVGFISNFLTNPNITISDEKVRISITRFGTYDNSPRNALGAINDVTFDSWKAADKDAVLGVFQGNWWDVLSRGNTPTNKGMEMAFEQLISDSTRPDVPKLMIVITDGAASTRSSCYYSEPGGCPCSASNGCRGKLVADRARENGITVIAVGVSKYIKQELLDIAGGDSEKVITARNFNGLDNNALTQLLNSVCTRVPRNGGWSQWSEGPCSTSCGDGTKTKIRYCNHPYPNKYGRPCAEDANVGTYTDTQLNNVQTRQHTVQADCKDRECPISCVLNAWTAWSDCSGTCPGDQTTIAGSRTRTRTIQTPGSNGGTVCNPDDMTQSSACEKTGCFVHCTMYDWTPWANCDAVENCNRVDATAIGQKSRTRAVKQPALNGGNACGETTSYAPCEETQCPIDCRQSDWSGWNACNAADNCDGIVAKVDGVEERTRTITTAPLNGGRQCKAAEDTRVCSKHDCYVDCRVTSWSEWQACNAITFCSSDRDTPNANGTRAHRRAQVAGTPANGGSECPAMTETEACSTDQCPVNCLQSQWSEWSACNAVCSAANGVSTSKGESTITRSVERPALNNGAACGADTRTRECLIDCPLDCTVSAWTSWTCNALQNCDRLTASADGVENRTCTILANSEGIFGAMNNGAACPALSQTQACSTSVCPVDCVVGAWTEWQCNAMTNCAAPGVAGVEEIVKGTKTRSRPVTTAAANAGAMTCPVLSETEDCYTGPETENQVCPKNCILSNWTEWGEWDVPCGEAQRTRTRRVTQAANQGGTDCSPSDLGNLLDTGRETKPDCSCATDPTLCCTVGDWTAWSITDLMSQCGNAAESASISPVSFSRTHTREASYNPSGLTSPELIAQHCPILTETESQTVACPLDCILDTPVRGPCIFTCPVGRDDATGSGELTVSRVIIRQPINEGLACDPGLVSSNEACTVETCPVDCQWSEWQGWTDCSLTCGGGSRTNTRTGTASENGGVACGANDGTATEACNQHSCPIDCVLSDWAVLKECNANTFCEGIVPTASGTETISREVIVRELFGGLACDRNQTFTYPCETDLCDVDCITDWVQGACDASSACDKLAVAEGFENWTPTTVREPHNNGETCPDPSATRVVPCTALCNVDCELAPWSSYGICSVTCGEGVQWSTRDIITDQANDGAACGVTKRSQACTEDSGCPVNCVLSDWSTWALIAPVTCNGVDSTGPGTQERTRTVVTPAANNGIACGHLRETASTSEPCNVDCLLAEWSEWDACDVKCGSGNKIAYRNVTRSPANGGAACASLTKTEACTDNSECPIDCVLSAWGEESDCVAICDGVTVRVAGSMTTSRTIITHPQFGGVECEALEKFGTCWRDCDVNCQVGEWTEWTVCQCNIDADRSRSRYTTVLPANNGQLCPVMDQTE
eukprot:Ihof_evm1s645 gene=Ihof_evmTU1s645